MKALMTLALLLSAFAAHATGTGDTGSAGGMDLSKLPVIGRTGVGMNTLDNQQYPCEIQYTDWDTLIIKQNGAYYSDLGGIYGKSVVSSERKGDTLVLRTGKSGIHENSFLCGKGIATIQGEYTEAKISSNRVEITVSYRCLPNPVRQSYTYTCDLK